MPEYLVEHDVVALRHQASRGAGVALSEGKLGSLAGLKTEEILHGCCLASGFEGSSCVESVPANAQREHSMNDVVVFHRPHEHVQLDEEHCDNGVLG